MTYKVTLNGGTKKDVIDGFNKQADELIEQKNMSADNKKAVLAMLDAIPGTHLSGTITDNNNGSVVVAVTGRTQVDVETYVTAKGKMEGAAGNGRPGVAGGTTAAGGPKPVGPTATK